MKICMLATSFPRHQDDFVGQWVLGLAKGLVEAGAQVQVVVPHDRDTAAHENYAGVDVHRFSYWLPKSAHGLCYGAGIPTNIRQRRWLALQFPPLEAAFLRAALRYGRDADIYNAHWTFAALPTVLASKVLRKPLVTHAYSAEFIPKALHPLNRLVVRSSAAVISISRYTGTTVEKVITPRQHHVIWLGVNQEKIAPAGFDAAAFRQAKGIGSGEKLLFAVGRLVERKGYHVLIEALAQLARQQKPYKLLLAGKGPQKEELEAQIRQFGIETQVQLIGFVPDEELSLYLKASDVLVMPSIVDHTGDTEGLGLPLIEAMANSTPVVASAIGGILDIVQHEQTGLLVTPGDPADLAQGLDRLLTDETLRAKVIAGGNQLANGPFSWAAIARETLTVFERALAGNTWRAAVE